MMKGNSIIVAKWMAVFGAFMGWCAVVLQLYLMLQVKEVPVAETLVRFFSFFTILTNTLVAICFTAVAFSSKKQHLFSSPSVLSATTVYIVIVGAVYNLVLRQTWDPQGLQKIVDELLHSVIPLYFFIFWLLVVNKKTLQWNLAFSWLLYPVLYLVFILLRGAASGFYPYPFINVPILGYSKVAVNALILFFTFLCLSLLLIALGKALARRQA
jgi:hypothetical protein